MTAATPTSSAPAPSPTASAGESRKVYALANKIIKHLQEVIEKMKSWNLLSINEVFSGHLEPGRRP
ncbi:hypothetical protein KIN20_003643 [Parelaphostrongylus tenuis]|uniref:Uncharacterized protein n=1 Tax=Parelaphostrongylus tenuis TaxID=148309 RepID=A0AAD5QG68_PARTN|nr:hypothetical protein KIN20_003643 [Parelaphostrongylus tenuis]